MMIFVSTILAFSLPKLIIRRLVYIHAVSSLRRASPMPFSKNSIAHSCKLFAYRGGAVHTFEKVLSADRDQTPSGFLTKKCANCKL